MSDFLKEIIKNQLGYKRFDWADGEAPPFHTSDMGFPPSPIGQRNDSGYAGTTLEIKSCAGCYLNHRQQCNHPAADHMPVFGVGNDTVHEKCPLKYHGMFLYVKVVKP